MREDRELGRKDASVEGGSGGGYIVLNPVRSHDNCGSYSTPSEGSSLTHPHLFKVVSHGVTELAFFAFHLIGQSGDTLSFLEAAVRKFLLGGVTQRKRRHREATFLTKC